MTPMPEEEPRVADVPKTTIKGMIGGMFGRAKQAMTESKPVPAETEKLLEELPHEPAPAQQEMQPEPKTATTKGRSKTIQEDPDQLEIPAFLRRRD